MAHVVAQNRQLAPRLTPSLELFDGGAVAGFEHPALSLGGFLFFVFAQANGKKHKIEGTERKCQKLNRHHRARVEQCGVDVGGIVKDVIDERQD